jgi:hypothetical protein
MADTAMPCEVLPLPDQQVAFLIAGRERLRWHFGNAYPRPFFYPFLGPSGSPLTRMGHPGAPNHDHHRSIWFAHEKVLGIDFWSDRTAARIRQEQWLAYQDGPDEAVMAVLLGWYDGHDPAPLLEQELVAALRPGEHGETSLELQSTFRPRSARFEFGKTNFGFLAVRVAKAISAHFGGGCLTNSDGRVGEEAIFGQPARWVDYSGQVTVSSGETTRTMEEGITYFDHPGNPRYPTHWHVRSDGWMGAAFCLAEPCSVSRDEPLVLRYLLHAHRGRADAERAEQVSRQFAASAAFAVGRANVPHLDRIVQRV